MTNHDPLETPAAPGSYKWKALITTAMGALMATMDFSITNIAFPALTQVFEKEITTVMWVTVAYILASTSSLLILGRVSDMIGRKNVYSIGMLIFTLALIACSLARTVGQLIFFRCFQGLGAAMIVSCGMTIVTEAFPLRETGRGIGLLGVSVSLGFVIGPVLGGFLLDWLDWRSIFYVRAPVSLLTLILSILLLKKDRPASRAVRLDYMGAVTSFLGLFCLVYGVSRSRSGLLSPATLVWVGTGVFLLVLFMLLQQRSPDPLLDLSLFRNRTFLVASLALFFNFVAAPPFILIMPFYLLEGIRVEPSEAGFVLAVNAVATSICGPVIGSLSDRFGPERFAAAGTAAMGAAFVLMMFFDVHTGMPAIVAVLILLGIGIGMFQTPNSSMIMGSVPRNRLGTASALLATLRQVGLSIGMAFAGALFASRLLAHQSHWIRQGAEGGEAVRQSIPMAFHETLVFSIVLSLVVFVLSLVKRKESGGPV
jgi:EmrB/QacA subfamily drug resistance transporter